jgi:4-amino-4-deoxy-L-arabinose transferase-like glycosyltransferase
MTAIKEISQRLKYLGASGGVIAIYALATLPILLKFPSVWPDEVNLYEPAAALARGQGMGTSVLAGFLPGIDRFTYWQPPGYFFFLSLVLRFVAPAHHFVAMRLFSWSLGVVVLVLGAAMLKRLAPSSVWALLGLVILATQVSFMQSANVGRMEMPTLACMMAALCAYLAYRAKGRRWSLVMAGLFAGLAMLFHPVGILAPAVMVLSELVAPSWRELRLKNAVIFAGVITLVFLPWFIYIAQAPRLFQAQMSGQSIRKSLYLGFLLTTRGYKFWLLSPFGNASCPLGNRWLGVWPLPIGNSALIPALLLGVGLAALLAKTGSRAEASMLGAWALGGYAINLFMPEFWYTVYFITPSCLLLGWAVAESSQRWMRAAALATLLAAGAWNYAEVSLISFDCQDARMAYQFYCLTLSRTIPDHSTILLASIPDPYFGLLATGKSYRLYEFVPVGVPLDAAGAGQTMARIDYVVGSDCCRPQYLADYLTAHGKVEADLGRRDFLSPPVLLWKLHEHSDLAAPQVETPGKAGH